MAALRKVLGAIKIKSYSPGIQILQNRTAYIGQPVVDSPAVPRNYEVSRDPKEWQMVTRLLNHRTVPAVTPKESYPSGWTPPSEKARSLPYFVERSKNHMLPVYLHNEQRGIVKLTVIRHIQGDIWKLHNEVKLYVEGKHGRRIASQVLETNSVVKLKGDFYHWVEEWMLSKGF